MLTARLDRLLLMPMTRALSITRPEIHLRAGATIARVIEVEHEMSRESAVERGGRVAPMSVVLFREPFDPNQCGVATAGDRPAVAWPLARFVSRANTTVMARTPPAQAERAARDAAKWDHRHGDERWNELAEGTSANGPEALLEQEPGGPGPGRHCHVGPPTLGVGVAPGQGQGWGGAGAGE